MCGRLCNNNTDAPVSIMTVKHADGSLFWQLQEVNIILVPLWTPNLVLTHTTLRPRVPRARLSVCPTNLLTAILREWSSLDYNQILQEAYSDNKLRMKLI